MLRFVLDMGVEESILVWSDRVRKHITKGGIMKTMKEIIGADAAKLAGLQIDLLQKVRSGQISLSQMEGSVTFRQRKGRCFLEAAEMEKFLTNLFLELSAHPAT